MSESKWHMATVLAATAGGAWHTPGTGLWLLFAVEGRKDDLRVLFYTEHYDHTRQKHGRQILGDMARILGSVNPKEWVGHRLGVQLRELTGIPLDGIQSMVREVCAEADVPSRQRNGMVVPYAQTSGRESRTNARFEVDLSW